MREREKERERKRMNIDIKGNNSYIANSKPTPAITEFISIIINQLIYHILVSISKLRKSPSQLCSRAQGKWHPWQPM